MFSAEYERELSAYQDFSHGVSGRFEGGGMIHTAIFEGRTGMDSHFDGTPVQLLIVEFHLAGSIEDRLWPVRGAFYIANAVFQVGWNDDDTGSGWMTKGGSRRRA